MIVLNTESGTGSSRSVRLALLSAAVERVRGDEPTVLITPAGQAKFLLHGGFPWGW